MGWGGTGASFEELWALTRARARARARVGGVGLVLASRSCGLSLVAYSLSYCHLVNHLNSKHFEL